MNPIMFHTFIKGERLERRKMPMNFVEDAKLSGIRVLRDGFVHADANVVRTGIQLYRGDEVGMPEKKVVRVYRPENEVKDVSSVFTFSHTPITVGHPKERVTADNWKKFAVGEVSTEAEWKDGKLKLPLILKDASAIALVQNGTRELSAGYTCDLDPTPGKTEDGQVYDAVQRDIRINHVAIVPRGRAGSECRIGDADTWGAMPVKDEEVKMKTIVIGDRAVQVNDEDAEFVKGLNDRAKAFDAEMATKDSQIADLEKKVSELETKISDTAEIDARVEARATLISDAAKLAPKAEIKGLKDEEIRRAVVEAVRGKAFVDEKSDDYVKVAFDLLVADAADEKTTKPRPVYDPVRKALSDGNGVTHDAHSSQIQYENAMRDAWKSGWEKGVN